MSFFFSMGFLEKKGATTGINLVKFSATSRDRFNSQKVAFWKGKLSYFRKKSRLVKYDNLSRFMFFLFWDILNLDFFRGK